MKPNLNASTFTQNENAILNTSDEIYVGKLM